MSSPRMGKLVAMARTDDDSWDITEGVGQTALGVAWSRSQEATSDCPLFTDPYAQLFVDAALDRGWQMPPKYMLDRVRSIGGYAASRTKWFDEFFIAAGANGIEQAVILAAGLDARGWRLPWVDGTVLYEIDQPKVLEFKTQTLARHDAKPSVSRYVAVPVDLRQDWPKALRDAGFDATEPTAWAAEGLLPYLPAEGQDLLFERINELSASGSRIGVESFGGGFFDRDYLASRREQMRRLREEAGEDPDANVPDTQDLWYIEDRTDVAEWLTEHNWEVSAVESVDLMTRYGRWTPGQDDAVAPRTVFLDGHLVC
jgi:methyltransferase (TIGR00027 family)